MTTSLNADTPPTMARPAATEVRQRFIAEQAIRLINTCFPDILEEFGFEKVPCKASILRPFGLSERPSTYVLNRMLFAREVVRCWP